MKRGNSVLSNKGTKVGHRDNGLSVRRFEMIGKFLRVDSGFGQKRGPLRDLPLQSDF
jgi:hypothetical protein